MKNRFFSLLTLCIVALLFAGCGQQPQEKKEEFSTIYYEPKETVEATEKPEVEVEIEIKPELELKPETEPEIEEPEENRIKTEQSETKTEDIEDVETTEEIEVSIPNQEQYWNLNYFDLYQYLTDCGFENITESTENLGPENSVIYAEYNDWIFSIYTSAYGQYANLFITRKDVTGGFYRAFDYSDDRTKIIIAINKQADMVHQVTIEVLEDAIKGIIEFNNSKTHEKPYPIIENFIYPD